ncbi:hypothetical protein CON01_01080 [Bacillus thuringiensis]|uniref:Uncharacterized protein n=1 Tax=Bacillus thuringiensis TaxID=1428 RepID=A0A9X6U5E1_BACTU|nr:hypothetical protein [Bacillus thuringiensis]MEB9467799.1 hypothetical protein [Bacillus cereus]MDO6628683.1 hypothetical protein [Bacillus thuringiensis]MDO6659192.1 hypothetical protein [Bacillus thuringiensis]MDO6698774.1 hypothetical protein [Bacillus thuringiensis]MRA82406.1 hypothetical protein [Bacillus thuringiensis]
MSTYDERAALRDKLKSIEKEKIELEKTSRWCLQRLAELDERDRADKTSRVYNKSDDNIVEEIKSSSPSDITKRVKDIIRVHQENGEKQVSLDMIIIGVFGEDDVEGIDIESFKADVAALLGHDKEVEKVRRGFYRLKED